MFPWCNSIIFSLFVFFFKFLGNNNCFYAQKKIKTIIFIFLYFLFFTLKMGICYLKTSADPFESGGVCRVRGSIRFYVGDKISFAPALAKNKNKKVMVLKLPIPNTPAAIFGGTGTWKGKNGDPPQRPLVSSHGQPICYPWTKQKW